MRVPRERSELQDEPGLWVRSTAQWRQGAGEREHREPQELRDGEVRGHREPQERQGAEEQGHRELQELRGAEEQERRGVREEWVR